MTGGGDSLGAYPGVVAFLAILSSVSVIFNIMVIVIVVKYKSKKSNIDDFIINLSISDIFFAGVALPMRLINEQDARNHFGGDVICKLMMFIPMVSVTVSILTMVILSVDRYRLIVRQDHLHHRHHRIAILIIWVLGIALASPTIYEYNLYEKVDEEYTNTTIIACGSKGIVENFEMCYSIIILVMSYGIPLLIIAGCYSRVLVHVWKNTMKVNGPEQNSGGGQLMKIRVKIMKMLFTMTLVFALLWAPFFVLFTMEEILDLDDTSESTSWPNIIKQTTVVLSTITNPTMYALFDQSFRGHVVTLLTCRKTQHGVAPLPLPFGANKPADSTSRQEPPTLQIAP